MSLTIAKPEYKDVPINILEIASTKYKDGIGFAIASENKIEIYKGFDDFDLFKEFYFEASYNQKTPALIHFREANSGDRSQVNCQPFDLGDIAFVNCNRMYHIRPSGGQSDGCVLAMYFKDMARYGVGVFESEGFMRFLSRLGTNSMVFMNRIGKFCFANQSKGYINDEIWYSELVEQHKSKQLSLSVDEEEEVLNCLACNKKLVDKEEINYGVCAECSEKLWSQTLYNKKPNNKNLPVVISKETTTARPAKPQPTNFYGE